MSEWWLICLLVSLALVACSVMVYPLRAKPIMVVLVAPIILFLGCAGYYLWGGFAPWRDFQHQNDSQKLAQQLLKSIKSPEELIAKLKTKLDDTPNSAKGWYLLGKLYANQNELLDASKAFATAHKLKPDDEEYTVNYAHSLWQLNNQKFTPQIKNLFTSLLSKNPSQPDALAMLAMNAFVGHSYEDAINYWQRLLKFAPEQSEESLAIRKAIAKAQEQIILARDQNK